MFFGKKGKIKCENCGSHSEKNYSFCPTCGNSLTNKVKDRKEYGLLGKNDFSELDFPNQQKNLGLTDKLLTSMINSVMKNLDKQFKEQLKEMEEELGDAEIKSFPNGIKIKISGPFRQQKNAPRAPQNIKPRTINDEQAKKISTLPREKAKTSVKRLGNKIVYELATQGVTSPQDIFISKLESGYEIKAIGEKKIYINNIPLNLPLKKYSISKDRLSVEFSQQENLF